MKIGIIGVGYWGEKILQTLVAFAGMEIFVCDINQQRLINALNSFPLLLSRSQCFSDYRKLLALPAIDAVIIATPAETHFTIAREALEAGKNTFVEKPMCLQTRHAELLAQLVRTSKKKFFVNHTYLHSKCLHFIKKILDENWLGSKIYYLHSTRAQTGVYRAHNVLWDLGPHDFAILKYLFHEDITNMQGIGNSNFTPLNKRLEDTVFLKLSYKNGISASMYLSWCHPKKIRDIVIVGEEKMLLFENNDKVSIFEHNLSPSDTAKNLNNKLVHEYSPNDDPLSNTLNCFIECIKKDVDTPPLGSCVDFASEIVFLLVSAQQTLTNFPNKQIMLPIARSEY